LIEHVKIITGIVPWSKMILFEVTVIPRKRSKNKGRIQSTNFLLHVVTELIKHTLSF